MTSQWACAKRVLAIRLDCMGDVLMTGPALKALKQGAEDRIVTLLTSSSGAAAASLMPYIDDVVVASPPWMKTQAADALETQALIRKLMIRGYDAAVIFTVYSQSALPAGMLSYLAGIPVRLAHCRENPYHLITHWIPEVEPQTLVRHEVERQLALVGHAGCDSAPAPIAIEIPQSATREVAAALEEATLLCPNAPWIAVHPGSAASSRRYPPQSFAKVAGLLYRQMGCACLYTGAVDEVPLVREIQSLSGVPSMSLAGKLTLPQMAALLKSAPLLLCNNTGPAHLAAAVGTSVVDLYALTNPQHAPWMVPSRVLFHDVPCRYCYKSICPEGHHACLRKVEPKEVAQAVMELLATTRRCAAWSSQGSFLPPLSSSAIQPPLPV